MKKKILALVMGFLIVGATANVWAGEVDVLLDKLVEKGILTPLEANIIKDETKQQVAKEISEQKSYASPEWAQRIKMYGDFRLRNQYERREADTESRSRLRIRYRLGIEAQVNKTTKVAAGLSSGGTDPRSTTQTLQDSFAKIDARLDYAFAEWAPLTGLQIAGGKLKMPNYLWTPTDFIWDTDITPDGASLHYEHGLVKNLDGFFNAGIWVLDEFNRTDRSDPYLNYVQGGLAWTQDKWDAKAAATYYAFNSLKGINPDNSSSTNTRISTSSVLVNDYDSVGVSGEVGFNNIFGGLPLHIDERIAFMGDFIHNVDPTEERNDGWAAGMKFGNKAVKEAKQWQAKYLFVRLGADAFPDFLPDSDRYGGETGIRSHEVIFDYGLNKNVTLGLDYYYSARIKRDANHEQLVQTDVNFKF